jgi:hypothetical protein
VGRNSDTSHHWQFTGDGKPPMSWSQAPRAAFPTYSFSVRRGHGLGLALPIQSVPVALSLLGPQMQRGASRLPTPSRMACHSSHSSGSFEHGQQNNMMSCPTTSQLAETCDG